MIDDERHDLDAGDTVTFDADLPHHFANHGDGTARFLAVGRGGVEKRLMARTLFDKIWQAHEVADGLIYVDLHLVHEVTSPQAFDGLRLEGRGSAPARPHDRDRGPQRAHRRHGGGAPDRRPALPGAGRDPGAQLRGVRRAALLARLRATGDRARDRARARADPARDDDRLRRQPHLDSRRVRGARVRDRHLRGRARARDPVPGPEAPADDADLLLGPARRRASPRRT